MKADLYQDAIVVQAKQATRAGRLEAPDASITLDNPAKGAITSTQLTGTAAQLTQRVREATFKPTVNRVAVGQTETTTLTLSVTDGSASKSNSQWLLSGESIGLGELL